MHRANIDACSRPLTWSCTATYSTLWGLMQGFWRLWCRTPPLRFYSSTWARSSLPFPLSQTHVHSNAQKQMHKTLLSVTGNGCRTAGKSQIWFGYTCGSGGRLNFSIILEVCIRAWANTKTPIAGLVSTVNGHLQCSSTNTPPGTLREDWMNLTSSSGATNLLWSTSENKKEALFTNHNK